MGSNYRFSNIIVFDTSSKGNALTKDEIKEYVKNQPFDFQQMTRDSEAYNELLFRERDRIFQFVEIDNNPKQYKNVECIIFYMQ